MNSPSLSEIQSLLDSTQFDDMPKLRIAVLRNVVVVDVLAGENWFLTSTGHTEHWRICCCQRDLDAEEMTLWQCLLLVRRVWPFPECCTCLSMDILVYEVILLHADHGLV